MATYTKTTFVNGQAPAVSAEELNKLGAGIEDVYNNSFYVDMKVGSFSSTVSFSTKEQTVTANYSVPNKRFYWIMGHGNAIFIDRYNPSYMIWWSKINTNSTQSMIVRVGQTGQAIVSGNSDSTDLILIELLNATTFMFTYKNNNDIASISTTANWSYMAW